MSGDMGAQCHEFIDTGRCGHSDSEHDAMSDGRDMGAEVAAVLAAIREEVDHSPSCVCCPPLAEVIVTALAPFIAVREREAVRRWIQDAPADVLGGIIEAAKAEALREAADVSLLDLATHGCGWRTLDHDSTAVKGYCGSTTAEALNDWLRDRADAERQRQQPWHPASRGWVG